MKIIIIKKWIETKCGGWGGKGYANELPTAAEAKPLEPHEMIVQNLWSETLKSVLILAKFVQVRNSNGLNPVSCNGFQIFRKAFQISMHFFRTFTYWEQWVHRWNATRKHLPEEWRICYIGCIHKVIFDHFFHFYSFCIYAYKNA